MIRTGKKFSKSERSRVINGDRVVVATERGRKYGKMAEKSGGPIKIGEFTESEPEKMEKVRLDVLMGEIFKSYHRSTLQKFIKLGFVTVEGETVRRANQKFERGTKIVLTVPEEMKNADLVPRVIFENADVIVFDKPAGLLSMAKGQYCPENTMEKYGLVVHRLDRDTSGVVIMAKNEAAQLFLKRQFQARTAHKAYFAIVSGRPKLDTARIDLPIMRDLKRPTTFRVEAGGKSAETFYKVLRSDGKHSLVELRPTTGRTHQLRVHLKYLGTPIVGDRVYGTEKAERMFLHAGRLEVTLPGGERRIFEAELPREFSEFWGADVF